MAPSSLFSTVSYRASNGLQDTKSIPMEAFVTDLFMKCVYALQWLGGTPGSYGYGYYLANIIVFVIVQPALIVLFFILWRKEISKNRINERL